MKKLLLILIFFVVGFSQVKAQETEASIDLIAFNTDVVYGNNSSVSVHIKPNGIFQVTNFLELGNSFDGNNTFVLELSDDQGIFTSPVILSTVYDFYTPLINAKLPNDLTPGTNYKLRVRASLGLLADGTYSEVLSPETLPFVVTENTISDYVNIFSQSTVNNNFFQCAGEEEGYSINISIHIC